MRFNMHEEILVAVRPNMSKKLIILIWSWFGLVIGLLDFCLCYYIQQYLVASTLTIMILVVILICWLSVLDLEKSYIDINDEKITVVEYNFGIKKIKTFTVSDIKYITYSNGNAFAIKGTRNRYTEYIILKDIERKYLFKIIDTPRTRDYFENLIAQDL